MRRILLFALLLLPLGVCAQDTSVLTDNPSGVYDHFFSEGKKWVYDEIVRGPFGRQDHECSIEIQGDTIIDGDSYWKGYYSDGYRDTTYLYQFYREDNGCVYYRNADEDKTCKSYCFRMGIEDVNVLYQEQTGKNNLIVKNIDWVELNDYKFKRWEFYYAEAPENVDHVWVYGIGGETYGIQDPHYNLPRADTGDEIRFIISFKSCYENGECIFTSSDFYKNTTGIHKLEKTSSAQTSLYDLSGRKLPSLQVGGRLHKGVYIQGGKKFVVK